MAKRDKYRAKFLRWHKSYEKRAYKVFKKVFVKYGKSIDLTDVKPHELENYLKKTLDIDLLYDAYAEVYTEIGFTHRQRVLKGINLDAKGFPIHADFTGFKKDVIKYLMKFGGERIVSVHESYILTISKIIRKEITKEYNIYDTAQTILELVMDSEWFKKKKWPWEQPKYYKWQAMRISRTETTAASNYAALQAADDTGFVMEKEWISVGRGYDGRTREHEKGDLFDHVDMDGQKVPRYAKFELRSSKGEKDSLDFPGDPNGHPSDVINCRCTVALIAKRDRAGNLIPTF